MHICLMQIPLQLTFIRRGKVQECKLQLFEAATRVWAQDKSSTLLFIQHFFFKFDLELQFDFKVRFGLILPLQFSHQVDKWRVLGAVLSFAFHSIRFFSNFDLESEFDFKISFSSPTKSTSGEY